MLNDRRSLAARLVPVVAVALLGLAPGAAAREAPDDNVTTFVNVGTVTTPAVDAIKAGKTVTNPTGLFASFDISWVDNDRGLYYLADRSNNAVDVVDAIDGHFVKYLGKGDFSGVVTVPPAPAGPNRNGPDGVVTDRHGNVWVGDGLENGVGTSSLKEYNPNSGAQLANIPLMPNPTTNSTGRADELAYGNVGGGRILIANPNETASAFVSLVDTSKKEVIGTLVYDAPASSGLPPVGHGFNTNFGTPATQRGLEQPAFANGKFYLNVPSTIQNPNGEIDVFDPNVAKLTAIFPFATNCVGTGLTVGRNGDLFAECADSLREVDANTGALDASFPDLGGADEIWFNPGDGNVYVPVPGASGGLGVLAAGNHDLGVTPIDGAQGLHSIAADAHSGRIFVPSADSPSDNGGGGIVMMHKARQGGDSE
jgi:hypothetical protein